MPLLLLLPEGQATKLSPKHPLEHIEGIGGEEGVAGRRVASGGLTCPPAAAAAPARGGEAIVLRPSVPIRQDLVCRRDGREGLVRPGAVGLGALPVGMVPEGEPPVRPPDVGRGGIARDGQDRVRAWRGGGHDGRAGGISGGSERWGRVFVCVCRGVRRSRFSNF